MFMSSKVSNICNLSHTHDITNSQRRRTVVLIDVITIPKWQTAAIFEFGKIAITLPKIKGFGSNFVRRYQIAP